MSTTRLLIYNGALTVCGERTLASLTENREPRYLLDNVWNGDGVKGCLEAGQWYFAMRTVQIDYDPGIEPDFGYQHAFDKPTDWIRTAALCSDPYFRVPHLQYSDENGYWYSDLSTIYVRYVSNDAAYGQNLGVWPRTFTDFVEAHFASKIIWKLTGDDNKRVKVEGLRKTTLLNAKSKAAMADSTQFAPQGSWVSARMSRGYRRDGGGNTGGNLY